MTRLADFIHSSINKDVMVKKAKYQACAFDSHLHKKMLEAHCHNLASSPLFIVGAAITSILVVRKGKFSTLRKLVMLKRLADSFISPKK